MTTVCMVHIAFVLTVYWGPSVTTASRFLNSVAGPYRIIPDHIERCPPSMTNDLLKDLNYHSSRDRNNLDVWYYSANATTLFTLDDSYDFDLNWASWSSRGGWKDNAYVMRPGRFCKIFPLHNPVLWQRLMVEAFDDPQRKCPFPPGYYEVRNISTDLNLKMIPVFFYGTWRITVRLVKDSAQKAALCARFFGKTIPKS